MSQLKEVTEKNPGNRWEPGHPRYGGRKKRSAAQARALAEEIGVDPLQFLLELVRDGTATKTVIENGKRKKVTVEVPLEMRVDAAKHVSRFMYPALSAQQVQAEVAVDVDAQTLPTMAILQNPALCESLSELALLVATQGLEDGKQVPAQLPPTMTDAVIDD